MTGLVLMALALNPCPPAALVESGECLILPTDAVVRVYDGDTLTVRVDTWPPIFREVSIRLDGYDTPEIRGRCPEERALALAARQRLLEFLAGAAWIRLNDVRSGNYFRLIAELTVAGESVGEQLIAEGLARPYGGGSRQGWCP